MLILHHGHSEFLLETALLRILTDPFDAHVGYPMREVFCDAVTVSHGHGDHSFTEKVRACAGSLSLCDHAGRTALSPNVTVTGIPSFHDDQQGAQRGANLIFLLESEGLRVAHLGDLGAWDEPLAEQLSDLDIVFVPVGGYYTIDAAQAAALVRRIRPRIVIPMHYRTAANASWPIAPVDDFLSALGTPDAPRLPLLRVTRGDLSEQPPVVVLTDR